MSGNKFQKVGLEEIRQAALRLRSVLRETPLIPSNFHPDVYFKAENLQVTGSFKARTACNQVFQLSSADQRRGIVTASSGNFGQGVAFAANRLGISAKVVMMRHCNPLKVERTRAWGAEVVFCDNNLADRVRMMAEIARSEGRATVHPYDHPHAVAGNGAIALEILERFPEVRHIAAPVSGGGLISGVAVAIKALKPDIKIWGVQPAGNPTTYLSFQAGEPRSTEKAETIADGLMITTPGEFTFPIVQTYVDDFVVVEEESIRKAIRHFLHQERLVVEPSGAVPLAGVFEKKLPMEKTVLILSGGNIASELLVEASKS